MIRRRMPIMPKTWILILMMTAALTGCNFPSLSPTDLPTEVGATSEANPTSMILSTETQIPVEIPSVSPTIEVVTPSGTAPIDLPDYCRPFPDQIYPSSVEGWLDLPLWVKCGGSTEPILVNSPVDGLFWDYSNQTGKLLYGTEYTAGPNEPEIWIGNYALWIYDFRTGLSTKWIPGGVLEAKWAPEMDMQGQLGSAVIMGDGTIGLVTEPEKITSLANIKRYDSEMDACCITWSPKGDKLAYIKNEILYVITTTPQEPRMLAEEAYGRSEWVMEDQLLLFPSSIVKVATADGSGPFIPNIPDGNRVWVRPEKEIFWDAENRTLVFDEIHVASNPQSITWVYRFSETFENVVEQYSLVRQNTSYLLSWYDLGKTVITSDGDVIPILPDADQQIIEGVIDRIYQGRYMLWLEDDPSLRVSVSLNAQMKDADGNKITILNLDQGMRVRIAGKDIADGGGFLAQEIQILEDEQ